MPTYLSPGVYVEEIASGSAPIASLSTSTAGFIGIIEKDEMVIPIGPVIQQTDTFEIDEVEEIVVLLKDENTGKIDTNNYKITIDEKEVGKYNTTDKKITDIKGNEIGIVEGTIVPGTTKYDIKKNGTKIGEYDSQESTIKAVDNNTLEFDTGKYFITFKNFPVDDTKGNHEILIGDQKISNVEMKSENGKATILFDEKPQKKITVKYIVLSKQVKHEELDLKNGEKDFKLGKDTDLSTEIMLSAELNNYPANTDPNTWNVKANGIILQNTDTNKLNITRDEQNKKSKITISTELLKDQKLDLVDSGNKTKKSITITVDYQQKFPTFKSEVKNEVKLCTNFNEFKKYFGDFSSDEQHNRLALAVYGFFNNGGSRCYVSQIKPSDDIQKDVLDKFEAIDEIAIVAAPGITDKSIRSAIVTHCYKMGDRFAILDCIKDKPSSEIGADKPDNSDYAAYYFPWIKVFDPVKKIMNPNGRDEDFYTSLPPSGHIAGVYARVDAGRGVHKAPANEVIFGALGLDYKISKSQQDGLNPQGINCIRELNGNIRIWGARTIGGQDNGEFMYINVRRLFLSLRDSIDRGTQWTVFEPNDAELWAKIRRNINAYLTNVWRSGALFGASPQEAFFVKCDAENNPPEVRDLGQVIIEIGVAPVKPAEFVIFRLSQWAGS